MTKKYEMDQLIATEGDELEPCTVGYLDGYAVDDRTFEEVNFKLTLENEKLSVSWDESDDEYMKKFDQKWIKERVIEVALTYELQSNRDGFDDDVLLTEKDK